MGILRSPIGLKRVILPQESKEEVLVRIEGEYDIVRDYDFTAFGDLPLRLRHYMSGRPVVFPDLLDLSGATCFQQDVWKIVQTIGYGEARSYGWVAHQLGCDNAARAVGQALSKNPLPIIVPCHRVINSDGCLGGFSGGLDTKMHLLNLEAAWVAAISVA